MEKWLLKRNALIIIFCMLAAFALSSCGEMPGTIKSISVSPSSTLVGLSSTKQFSATAYDQNGKVMTATFTWSTSGGIGTIDASGLFYSGTGEVSGTVAAASSGISGTSSVSVTTKGSVSGKLTNGDNAAVSNIKVYLMAQSSLFGISDSSGNYLISSVPAGTWEIATSENALYVMTTSEVTVKTAEATSASMVLTSRFSITNEIISGTPISSITGSIKNNGSTTATGVTVTYAFYDDTGLLLGTAQGNVASISAGGAQSFSAYPSIAIDSYYSYTRTIAAQSY